ncbi:MAG TPA: DUF3179 domain-containing (seleno)protein, partial [Vicinamibacterales bacterium]|nr:DUF3179 domain-containing (seleno)protein [Vicinamibacterales bacterium]
MRSAALVLLASLAASQSPGPPSVSLFLDAASADAGVSTRALDVIGASWRDSYTALIVDAARFLPRDPSASEGVERLEADAEGAVGLRTQRPASTPASRARLRLIRFLQARTGQRFGDDLGRWREWMWRLPYDPHPDYPAYKREIYGRVDPRMRNFFPFGVRSDIRLDEIDWGGVTVNGIPPLVSPRVVPASGAGYLKDGHIVFGIVINGEARAYPRRILAWHEMARDRVGGVDLAVVYCTLCGTVIPYESRVAARSFTFGTSGLLYRSNKLMFDEET